MSDYSIENFIKDKVEENNNKLIQLYTLKSEQEPSKKFILKKATDYPQYLQSMNSELKIAALTSKLYRKFFNPHAPETLLMTDDERNVSIASEFIPNTKDLRKYEDKTQEKIKGLGRDLIFNWLFGNSIGKNFQGFNKSLLINENNESINIDLKLCFNYPKYDIKNASKNLLTLLLTLIDNKKNYSLQFGQRIDVNEINKVILAINKNKKQITEYLTKLNPQNQILSTNQIYKFEDRLKKICSLAQKISVKQDVTASSENMKDQKLFDFLTKINDQMQFFDPNWVNKTFNKIIITQDKDKILLIYYNISNKIWNMSRLESFKYIEKFDPLLAKSVNDIQQDLKQKIDELNLQLAQEDLKDKTINFIIIFVITSVSLICGIGILNKIFKGAFVPKPVSDLFNAGVKYFNPQATSDHVANLSKQSNTLSKAL